MKFLRQFMIILLLSFLGEVLKMFIPLPIPASVYGLVLMLVFDHGTFMDSCYECVSALATVGLTKGLTPNLTIAGKVIIIITMYLGRVGPISMAIGFSQKNKKKMVMYPEQDLIL